MRNERLIANAGSGKTHALTTRMIQLLAQGVEPRKIAALTFTRKSAGEFLSAVFGRLAEAALVPEKLAALRANAGLATLDADQCRGLLAKLAAQIGFLGMGTIDSLFSRIVRAFPLESGLAEDFAMAGEAEILSAREKALSALFSSESNASLADFLDLIRRIGRAHGERDVFQGLLRQTENLHGKFLATPEGCVWGDPSAIWGVSGCAVLAAGPVAPAAGRLWCEIQNASPGLRSEALSDWEKGLNLAARHQPPKAFSSDLRKFFVKLSNERSDANGQTYIPSGNAIAGRLFLGPRIRPLRDGLRNALARLEFDAALERSRSLHAFIRKFESAYGSLVRSAGLVTFGDITDALARNAGDEAWRTSAAYRIDQTFEHWLLDEFQDTSRPQWKILKTFIDEVLMDPAGGRSFFYVGDTKQAIYSWRGGDPDLFFEVFDGFQDGANPIHDAPPLSESYRSCRAILDFVNRVFGDLGNVQGTLEIPSAAVAKWQSAWSEHRTSPKTRDMDGFAEWISVPKGDGSDEEPGDAPDRKILEILESTQPWKRGLSCAVLKRDNNGVAALAALLQSNGIPVAVEGKTNPCTDNPLGTAIIAALRACASPDDTLSATIAQGFPVAEAWGLGDFPKFRSQTLAGLSQSGFAATIGRWIRQSGADAEPFLKERGAAFLLAAGEFDECRKSSDGIPEFLRFVENRRTQENEASDVVRIMNIHQSKGLGFDMVVVSGLDSKGGGNDGSNLLLGPSARDVRWGLLPPAKDFCILDEVLRNQLEAQEADSKYGELCTAYVALTRAKKALYVVTTELGEGTAAKNFARHLMLQFHAASAQFGNSDWHLAHELRDSIEPSEAASAKFAPPIQGTPKPVSPSSFKSESGMAPGDAQVSFGAAQLGTEVHEALARIEWMGGSCIEGAGLSDEAARLIRAFLEKPAAKEIFQKPKTPHELWREQAFDVVLDGEWVSGVFDRVFIELSADGSPASATIYDFKTDHGIDSEIEERYRGQMEVYRAAASKLLRLPVERIKASIVRIR